MKQEEITHRLEQIISEGAIPGASVSFYNGSEIITASAGLANVETDVSVNDQTIFQIGSITKIFTATLINQLAEAGKFNLDDPVRQYMPDLKINHQIVPESLTIRSLIDYSAGMEGDYFEDFGPDPDSLARYVDACQNLSFMHKPGEMRAYNSTAYCIAGRLIEVVTGQYYNDALSDYILKPLGLSEYCFYDHDVARYRTAVGHHNLASPTEPASFSVVDELRLPPCMSAAGAALTMTATGLLKFGLMHLKQGKTLEGTSLLSPEHVQAMYKPVKFVPPHESPLLMGWAKFDTDKGDLVIASGATNGQNSIMCFLPDHDFAFAALTNIASGAEQLFMTLCLPLIKELTGAVVELPKGFVPADILDQDPAISAEDAEVYLGKYTNNTILEILWQNNRLRLKSVGFSAATGEDVAEYSTLIPIDQHRFAMSPDATPQAIAGLEFLFEETGQDQASHISITNRLFARI